MAGGDPIEKRDTIVCFLPVKCHVIAKRLDVIYGKVFVGDLGFLQSDDSGLMSGDDGFQLMQPNSDAVDIKRNYSDS